jgi:hypothetical protein
MPPPRPQSTTLSPGSDGSAASAVRGVAAVSVGAAAGAARTATAAAPLPAEVPAAGASYLVRAVADFAAAEPGDLSVATDDLVLVTGEVSAAGVSLCSCMLLFLLASLLLCLRAPVSVCVVSACHCRCWRVRVPARCCGDRDGACVVLLVGSREPRVVGGSRWRVHWPVAHDVCGASGGGVLAVPAELCIQPQGATRARCVW